MLTDGERTVFEATCIVEHLDLYHPGPVRLIPADPKAALEVRMLDRFFDNYVSTPQQKIVYDALCLGLSDTCPSLATGSFGASQLKK